VRFEDSGIVHFEYFSGGWVVAGVGCAGCGTRVEGTGILTWRLSFNGARERCCMVARGWRFESEMIGLFLS
jgi:hypothetical protein